MLLGTPRSVICYNLLVIHMCVYPHMDPLLERQTRTIPGNKAGLGNGNEEWISPMLNLNPL